MKKLVRSKKKAPTLAQLKQKTWKVYSKWARQKDADENGNVACCSCGQVDHWKNMDAGHFIPKARGNVYYFHDQNVHAQCKRCNLFDVEMAKIGYTRFMIDRYGMEFIDYLHGLQGETVPYRRTDYLDMIETYTQRLKELEGE